MKLWLTLDNPYVASSWWIIEPHCIKLKIAVKHIIICILMLVLNIIEVIVQTMFILSRLLGAFIGSFYALVAMVAKKAENYILPSWDEALFALNYMATKGLFKEEDRE